MMIRDFPDFPIGWRGSYIFNWKNYSNPVEKIKNVALEEIKEHGCKYGAIVYDITGKELYKFNTKGEEI